MSVKWYIAHNGEAARTYPTETEFAEFVKLGHLLPRDHVHEGPIGC